MSASLLKFFVNHKFKTLHAVFVSLLFLSQTHAVARNRPLRIALYPNPSASRATPTEETQIIAGLHMRNRLDACVATARVPDARAQAIFGELKLTGGALTSSQEGFLEAFKQYLEVDALVFPEIHNNNLVLVVHHADGVTNIITHGHNDAQKARSAAKILAKTLNLAPTARAVLEDPVIKDDTEFSSIYFSNVATGHVSVGGPGGVRLKLLLPLWSNPRHSPDVAKQILRAILITKRGRGSKKDLPDLLLVAQRSIPLAIGIPDGEKAALDLITAYPEDYTEILLELVDPMINDAETDGIDMPEEGASLLAGPLLEQPEHEATETQRLGAVRLLGLLQDNRKALETLEVLTTHEQANVREAAADGLAKYKGSASEQLLRKLATDKNPRVAFAAAAALHERGADNAPPLLPAARRILNEPDLRKRALSFIAATGTKEDIPALREAVAEKDLRYIATQGLIRLGALDKTEVIALLKDTDNRLVALGLSSLPETQEAENIAFDLCDDPFEPIAIAARAALAPRRPETLREQMAFDLKTAHWYLRAKILDKLATLSEPWAVEMIEMATENRDAHTRANALAQLSNKAPAQAAPFVLKALKDPHYWVRLHASAITSRIAKPEHADAVRAALEAEPDEAIRLYLAKTLARVADEPEPAPRAPARQVADRPMVTWLFGGAGGSDSPFTGYYVGTVTVSETWKKGYKQGKIYFGRTTPVRQPGLVMVDRRWRDLFWLSLDGALDEDNLPFLDGLVFGEESMNLSPDTLWPAGWPLFCHDTGIDPVRVAGDMDNLDTYEKRAWQHWALERSVEGFNVLYDYVKTKYALIRPGLQVCTFLPEEASPPTPPNAVDWKFDVGGVYDYKGDNITAAYKMVRYYRTLWPDRPVLWLSLGIGGYEMNPVRRTQKMPSTPLLHQANRSYVDSMTAWLAGADPGWFSVWIFVDKDFKGGMADLRGVSISVEDIGVDSKPLETGIAYSFKGMEEDIELRDMELPTLEVDTTLENIPFVEDIDADAKFAKQQEAAAIEIENAKQSFRLGFMLYQQFVYDCARMFASLPRRLVKPDILACEPDINVWSRPRTPYPLIPALALPNEYDFTPDFNQVPGLDMRRYLLFIARPSTLLRDDTIATISSWLSEQPALLYLNLGVTPDNSAQASSPNDYSGILKLDWPWEKDIAPVVIPEVSGRPSKMTLTGPQGRELAISGAVHRVSFTCAGTHAEPLWQLGDQVVTALWRHPDFKGVVLFDGLESAGPAYIEELREIINGLNDQGIGVRLDGPRLHVSGTENNLFGASATRYCAQAVESRKYPGTDILTGKSNPLVKRGQATLVAGDYISKHIASGNGVTALTVKTFQVAEKTANGMRLQSPDLVRITGNGKINVKPVEGAVLKTPEDPVSWLFYSAEDGVFTFEREEDNSSVTWYRCGRPVDVRVTK